MTIEANGIDKNCTKCSRSMKGAGSVKCSVCFVWFHYKCLGITPALFKALPAELPPSMKICCENCQVKPPENSKPNADSPCPSSNDARLISLEQKLDFVCTKVDTMLSKLSAPPELQNRPLFSDVVKEGVSPSLHDTVKLIQAAASGEKHLRSVIAFGLQEAENDLNDATDLCNLVDPSAVPIEVFRLGRAKLSRKDTDKPRPLSIVFSSISVAKSVIASAKKLKEVQQYTGVFLRKSLSSTELENLSKLRLLRDKYNGSNGNKATKYMILTDRLVKIDNCEVSTNGGLGRGTIDKSFIPDLNFLDQTGS